MRLLLQDAPRFTLPNTEAKPWDPVQDWPAFWISPPAEWKRPWVAVFSCEFVVQAGAAVTDRFHVTADERYELYLDGKLIGRGSERGDQRIWYYDTYELTLAAGRHLLVARVWALGPTLHPWAQISIEPGFFCCPESAGLIEKVATGVGPWSVRRLDGYNFVNQSAAAGTAMGVGPSERFDAAAIPWGWESGTSASGGDCDGEGASGEETVRIGVGGNHGAEHYCTRPLHWLRPAALPVALSREWRWFRLLAAAGETLPEINWKAFIEGPRDGSAPTLTLEPRTTHRLIVDLTDYVCAYPELRWSGGAGARIALGWAEALRDPITGEKKRGDAAASDRWVGESDEIFADGGVGRWWRSLWWRCGCFVKLEIEVADELLILERLIIEETRYPFEPVVAWPATMDAQLAKVFSVCVRTLQMCMHETYMDCPYYEQLMYVGDTRIQCLITYALGGDDRLPRKCIELFDSSRINVSGFTAAAHPNNGAQVIAPFSLWWIAMVYDYARWRDDAGFVRARMPGVRAVLERFFAQVGEDGLMRSPAGWNFVDASFEGGIPPGGLVGEVSAVLQLQFLLALQHASALEKAFGEVELAARYERRAKELARVVLAEFWSEERGLVADESGRTKFSDHAQCLAVLTGILNVEQELSVFEAMLDAQRPMTRATVYFTHYFFEVCFKLGREDVFFERLEPWHQCVREGYKTFPESFGRTRSDCHAWSAHPLYHYVTGVMGARPTRVMRS